MPDETPKDQRVVLTLSSWADAEVTSSKEKEDQ